MRLFAFTALLAALLPISAVGDTTGGLSGTVSAVGLDGGPSGSARNGVVTICGPADCVRTNATAGGFFAVLSLPPGAYSVTATDDGPGYPAFELICVHAGEQQRLNLAVLRTHAKVDGLRVSSWNRYRPRKTAGPTMYSTMDGCPR